MESEYPDVIKIPDGAEGHAVLLSKRLSETPGVLSGTQSPRARSLSDWVSLIIALIIDSGGMLVSTAVLSPLDGIRVSGCYQDP